MCRPANEHREIERAITYWKKKAKQSWQSPTLMTLDVAEMNTDDWAYRFILGIDSLVTNDVMLIYGRKLAKLLDLPAKPFLDIPIIEQLPQRFVPLFVRGCSHASAALGVPMRMKGAVTREDGRRELYRAVFIGFGIKPGSLTRLAFGAFNSCVRDCRP